MYWYRIFNVFIAMIKYVLLTWPEAQDYIGKEGCYICTEIDGAVFVPEYMYEEDND